MLLPRGIAFNASATSVRRPPPLAHNRPMLPAPAIAPLTFLLIAAAYLLGSLSVGRVLARLHGARPGTGSGESGTVLRRRSITVVRLGFDIGKGALAAWLALRHAPVGDALSVTAHGYLAAFAAVLGHTWPIWHRFRGGAPTAVLVGGLLVLWPVGLAAWVIAGLLVWLLSGHPGLALVLGALCVLLLAWWGGADPPRLWFAGCAVLLLALVQRQHLWRLWTGTEPRFARARRLHRWRRR